MPGVASRAVDPANRCSSGSRAIERCSGAEAQQRDRSGYNPGYAGEQAQARRWKGSKLLRRPELQATVLELLSEGAVARGGRRPARSGARRTVVSYETIYRFIYAQIARNKDYTWRRYLPRGKSKRGFRGRKGGSSALHIEHRVPIAERPAHRSRRSPATGKPTPCSSPRPAKRILALHERSTRLIWMQRLSSKAAAAVAETSKRR